MLDAVLAQPVDLTQPHAARAQRFARSHDNAARWRIEPNDVKRMTGSDAKPPALAHRKMDDAAVPAQHSPIEIDDIAGLGGAGFEPLDDIRVAARRHETDVLAVVLVGDCKAETAAKRSMTVSLNRLS